MRKVFRAKTVANEYELERYLTAMDADGWDIKHLIAVGDSQKALIVHIRYEMDA